MAESSSSNKLDIKNLKKKKKPNKEKTNVSAFFRGIVSFSITVTLFFGIIFISGLFAGTNSAAQSAYNQGMVYFEEGRFASALDSFSEAVSLDESNAEYRLMLAKCYEETDNESALLDTISKGTILSPNEYKYSAFLIGYYVRNHQIEKAQSISDAITSVSVKTKISEASPKAVLITPPANQSGKFTEITLTSDEGATIYYTTDGTTPTMNSLKYEAPIDITSFPDSFTIKAIAINSEHLISSVSAVDYNFNDPSKKYIFADAKLGKIVAAALNKKVSSVTYSDLALITEIDSSVYSGTGSITTLEDLYNFKNLTSLYIENETEIKTFCDFTRLPLLTHLTLKNCGISENIFSSICNAKSLIYLDVSTNFITSGKAISRLQSLQTAILDENALTSLSVFQSNTALKKLSVAYNNIQSVAPIKSLTGLTELNLSYNSITEVGTLGGLTNLTSLNLAGNGITTINALGSLSNLKTLNLARNNIDSITALANKAKLKTLDLSFNLISSFAPLQSCNFDTLTVQNCGIGDLSEFASINAATLDLSNSSASSDIFAVENDFTDITPIAASSQMRYLKIINVKTLTSIAALSGNSSLDAIYCKGCSALSFADFENSTSIKIIK